MMKKTKEYLHKIYQIPFIGYLARLGVSLVRLPINMGQFAMDIQSNITNINNLQQTTENQHQSIDKFSDDLKNIYGKINNITIAQQPIAPTSPSKSSDHKYLADNHLLDDFYLNFENKFRGSEKDIADRLKEYLPYFKKIKKITNNKPVLDIGCGRGELLSLLNDNEIDALGVDLNKSMVDECNKKGLKAVQADAIEFLAKSKPEQFSAICGFHIIEHVEFGDLLNMFTVAYRALDDSGFALFETPNPANLSVGANTFYFDPSHIKPLPSELIKFTLENIGFRNVEVLKLHPERENLDDISIKLFGPRDYAVIAKK